MIVFPVFLAAVHCLSLSGHYVLQSVYENDQQLNATEWKQAALTITELEPNTYDLQIKVVNKFSGQMIINGESSHMTPLSSTLEAVYGADQKTEDMLLKLAQTYKRIDCEINSETIRLVGEGTQMVFMKENVAQSENELIQ